MPLYTYKCSCGNRHQVTKPMSESERPELCKKCSFVMSRDFQADFGKQHHGDTYPYASAALGVHPDELPARMAFDKAKGVPTDYDGECDPIMRSKKHRREFCRAHGVHDRNASYSDPVPD